MNGSCVSCALTSAPSTTLPYAARDQRHFTLSDLPLFFQTDRLETASLEPGLEMRFGNRETTGERLGRDMSVPISSLRLIHGSLVCCQCVILTKAFVTNPWTVQLIVQSMPLFSGCSTFRSLP